MKNFKYEQIENYETKKQNVLSAIQTANGGQLPKGFDQDMFVSALIKTIMYLEDNYKTKIKAEDIPDVASFTKEKAEYSITSFVLNRVLNNIKIVDFLDVRQDKPESIGGFSAGAKSLTMYSTAFKNNLGKMKNTDAIEQFESQEEMEKMLFESAIIHELIHAISYNGKAVGFKKSQEDVNLNEGMTEYLAKLIAGLEDLAVVNVHNSNMRYLVKTTTNASYDLQSNIFNLITIASKENLVIPYLVDADAIKFNSKEKQNLYGENPLQKIKLLLNKSIDYEKIENPITGEMKVVNRGDFGAYQQLQTLLIDDIFQNKYDNEFFTKMMKSGDLQNSAEYASIKKDMQTIGRCIVSTLDLKMDMEDRQDFAENDCFATANDVMKLIQNHVIAPTPNVLKYRDMLYKIESIEKQMQGDQEM